MSSWIILHLLIIFSTKQWNVNLLYFQPANGETDLSFFSPDCFHLSQKGHEAAADALWNNMVCILISSLVRKFL